MNSLIHYIEQQIQQLEYTELKEWLLHHFNRNASHLGELFALYHQPDSYLPAKILVSQEPFFLYQLINTYGPQTLIPELQRFTVAHSSLNAASYNHALIKYCTTRCNQFQQAWPLISQLTQQPEELIKHMMSAEPMVLQAFNEVVAAEDGCPLFVQLFLVKEESDWQGISKERSTLIKFLSQPQWVMQMQQLLKSLQAEASALLSLHCLMQHAPAVENEVVRLQQMQKLYTAYSFGVDRPVLKKVVSGYMPYLSQPVSAIQRELIILLHQLYKNMAVKEQEQLTSSLTVFDRIDLIEQCIILHTEDDRYQEVLHLLCAHTAVLKKDDRDLIRLQLMKEEQKSASSLFVTQQHFFALIPSLEATLRSPHFIATATPLAIKNLLARYRCIALTYSAEELFALIDEHAESNPYYQGIAVQLSHIEQVLATNLSTEAVRKKCQLINWFMDRIIHQLLSLLISEYLFSEQQQNAAALTRFFAYYCEQRIPLRSDLLFRAALHCYLRVEERDSDAAAINATQFMQKCQECFFKEQWDWHSLLQPNLYLFNDEGACIAVVDEFNKVWNLTLDDSLLFSAAQQQGYYNQAGECIGEVTDSGHFRRLSGSNYGLSAHILARTPIKELEHSAMGLSLLISDCLLESSIHLLAQSQELQQDAEKNSWLARQCLKVFQDSIYSFSSTTTDSLLAYFPLDDLFALLAKTANKANTLALFNSILRHDAAREVWFSGQYTPQFHLLLQKSGTDCLAEYLVRYYQMPWFLEGIMQFASYRQVDELLVSAVKQVQADMLDNSSAFAEVLLGLLHSQRAAEILLACFADNVQRPVQEGKELNKILTYFNKAHIMHLLQQILTQPTWHGCWQYRLTLYLLQAHYNVLFQVNTTSLMPWTRGEMKTLTAFIHRHLTEKSFWDANLALGFRILGALIFSQAAQGLNSLFTLGHKKLSPISAFQVHPLLLEQLVDDFVLPEFGPQGIAAERSTMASKRQYREQLVAQWPNNLALQTWQQLIVDSKRTNKMLPLLLIYLIHYSGPAQAIRQVLECYVLRVKVSRCRDLIHPISRLLTQFPQHAICAVIFDSIQAALLRKPWLLDATVFADLAQYYSVKNQSELHEPRAGKMQLISDWGHAKAYALVQQACRLLLVECGNAQTETRLQKALIETRAEAKIHLLMQNNPAYALSVKWLIRFWHYGFAWLNHPSGLVAFADAEEFNASPRTYSSGRIKMTDWQIGKVPFVQQRDELISLLAQVARSAIADSQRYDFSVRSGLFHYVPSTAQHHGVALPDEASQSSKAYV